MSVILYSMHCPKCMILKKKLLDKDIKFKEINSVSEMTKRGFMSVPILEVDGNIMDYQQASEWMMDK